MSQHPFRDALVGRPEEVEPLSWRTAVVTGIDTTSSPHRLTVRYADGTLQEGLTFLGWWKPELNAMVHVLVQGPARLVLGPNAPAQIVTSAAVTPPPPPAPPPAPPSVTTLTVTPTDMAAWDARYTRWRTDGLYQGGGWLQRAFWFYGGGIAAAKGSGTIVSGTIYVARENSSHGVAGDQQANVRLGTHGNGARPGSGGTAHGNVAVVGGLARGRSETFTLTAAQIAALNAGAPGLGLEPGVLGYTSADYLIATMGGASGTLSLTVQS